MKSITIAGRVGKTAELRRTQGGDPVTSWSVAVDDGFGEKKTTLWFDCSLWGKRGEALSKFLVKGTPVTVSGDLGKREHDGKTYLTVRVNEVTLQGSVEKKQAEPQSNTSGDLDDTDSIPF